MHSRISSSPRSPRSPLPCTSWLPLTLLSLLAVVMLQGFFHASGAFAAMGKHAEDGKFSNGKQLHKVYLGLPIIDKMLALSVSFWDPVCSGERSLFLLSLTISASLQSLGVFALIESLRRAEKGYILRWAPANIFCWQYLGAAIFVPIYFLAETAHHFTPGGIFGDPSLTLGNARALLPGTLATVVHCLRMAYFPPADATSAQHQAWLAVWQLAPVLAYIGITSLGLLLQPSNDKSASSGDSKWIKATYLTFGSLCAIAHIWVMWQLHSSSDPSTSLSRAFLPRLSNIFQSDAPSKLFIEESLWFLQWDVIIIVPASSFYALKTLERVISRDRKRFSVPTELLLVVALTGAQAVFSSGAVYAAVLYVREDFLRERYDSQHIVRSENKQIGHKSVQKSKQG